MIWFQYLKMRNKSTYHRMWQFARHDPSSPYTCRNRWAWYVPRCRGEHCRAWDLDRWCLASARSRAPRKSRPHRNEHGPLAVSSCAACGTLDRRHRGTRWRRRAATRSGNTSADPLGTDDWSLARIHASPFAPSRCLHRRLRSTSLSLSSRSIYEFSCTRRGTLWRMSHDLKEFEFYIGLVILKLYLTAL